MKKLLGIVVLGLFLITPSQADDIRDFEINGISLKDEISKHLNKSEIKEYKRKMFKTDEYITLQIPGSKFNSKDYDMIEINYKNPVLIVENISGVKFFKKIKKCYNQQNKYITELKDLFANNDKIKFLPKRTHSHGADPSGESIYTKASFEFSNGDKISIECNNFSKKMELDHQLYVAIDSKNFDNFLNSGRAY